VTVIRDEIYSSPDGVPLKADLYIPAAGARPLPVVIWVHGGGWRFYDRRLAPDLRRYFASAGFAMVAIDYRLTTQAIFPAQIEDLKTAIRWVRSVAGAHGFDPTRIGLIGSSAGGHLSALAGLTARPLFEPAGAPHLDCSSTVQAVVAAYPPTDFLQIDAHRPPDGVVSEDPETLLLPRGMTRSAAPDSFESLLVGAPIEQVPDRVRLANPVAYASPGAPPFLILHGTSDTTVPAHQSEILYDALASAGNDVALYLIEGLGHGFLNRTHLDDGPPRAMTVRRHAPGRGASLERVRRPIFGIVEAFLRERLHAR
jgi:acetyl esterase/lipase